MQLKTFNFLNHLVFIHKWRSKQALLVNQEMLKHGLYPPEPLHAQQFAAHLDGDPAWASKPTGT